MKITKEHVIETAIDIADTKGLNNVSLKSVAEALGIKSPSLYNHIENLDTLLAEIAYKGMMEMNQKMLYSSIGKTGLEALKSVSIEYLNYMIKHPGIYETIQWVNWHQDNETKSLYETYLDFMRKLVISINCKKKDVEFVVNMITSMIHGFTTLNLRFAFSKPKDTQEKLCLAIETIIKGISN